METGKVYDFDQQVLSVFQRRFLGGLLLAQIPGRLLLLLPERLLLAAELQLLKSKLTLLNGKSDGQDHHGQHGHCA
jgi:hypothetical protein